MNREIKFRGQRNSDGNWIVGYYYYDHISSKHFILRELDIAARHSVHNVKCEVMDIEVIPDSVGQYTGLKDKNCLTEIYEGDIVDENGLLKGNIYENHLDKKKTDTIIQGFGTKNWGKTVRRAVLCGCQYAE